MTSKSYLDEPIVWTGDLEDDCTARWSGLLLRAEWMEGERWWWAVSEISSNGEIASSNDDEAVKCRSGAEARRFAEWNARAYLEAKKL